MPGRFFLQRPIADVADALGVAKIDSDPPRMNIAPSQEVVTLTPDGLTRMRWGLIPQGRVNARGRPVMKPLINARSETVFQKSAFEGVKRCIVPVEGWYEWTGETRKKTAWRIAPVDGGLLYFAAVYDVWIAPGGREVAQVATVTCEPNADVRDVHHRMGVLLEHGDIGTWLTGTQQEAAQLMVPFADGRLRVEEAIGVNWKGA